MEISIANFIPQFVSTFINFMYQFILYLTQPVISYDSESHLLQIPHFFISQNFEFADFVLDIFGVNIPSFSIDALSVLSVTFITFIIVIGLIKFINVFN